MVGVRMRWCVLVVASLGVLITSGPVSASGNQSPRVVVVETNQGFKVDLAPGASLRAINTALERTGLDVTVQAKPVSASLVGEWVGGGTPHWTAMLKIDEQDRSRALLRRTKRRTVLFVGRGPQHGETYFAARDPFCPGEALAGSGIEELEPAAAKAAIEERGMHVTLREAVTTVVEPGHVAARGRVASDPPATVITQALADSPRRLFLVIVPAADYAATHRAVGRAC